MTLPTPSPREVLYLSLAALILSTLLMMISSQPVICEDENGQSHTFNTDYNLFTRDTMTVICEENNMTPARFQFL